jgi:hypothetical protein
LGRSPPAQRSVTALNARFAPKTPSVMANQMLRRACDDECFSFKLSQDIIETPCRSGSKLGEFSLSVSVGG